VKGAADADKIGQQPNVGRFESTRLGLLAIKSARLVSMAAVVNINNMMEVMARNNTGATSGVLSAQSIAAAPPAMPSTVLRGKGYGLHVDRGVHEVYGNLNAANQLVQSPDLGSRFAQMAAALVGLLGATAMAITRVLFAGRRAGTAATMHPAAPVRHGGIAARLTGGPAVRQAAGVSGERRPSLVHGVTVHFRFLLPGFSLGPPPPSTLPMMAWAPVSTVTFLTVTVCDPSLRSL